MPSGVDQPTTSFARSELQQAAPKSSIPSSLQSLVSRHQHSDQQGLPFAANHTTPHHTTPHHKRPFPLSLAQTCSTTLVHSVAACSLRRVSSLTTDIDPFEKGGMAAHLMQASTSTPAADQPNYNPTKDKHLPTSGFIGHVRDRLTLPTPRTINHFVRMLSGGRIYPSSNHFYLQTFGLLVRLSRASPALSSFRSVGEPLSRKLPWFGFPYCNPGPRSRCVWSEKQPSSTPFHLVAFSVAFRLPAVPTAVQATAAPGQSRATNSTAQRTEIERLSETALLVRPCRPSLSKICLPGQVHPAGAAAKGPGTWHFHGYLHTRDDLRFASSAHQPYLPRHPCKNAQNLRGKIYGPRAISKGKYPDATLSENTAGSQRRSML
ncbi:hypothetical protein CDEST_10783 [Colletotrichum destructivum]|uniref:Uncharacterized protein n=1 Tax=Colletotrichum destructivum TaxID=34406 RepID=A0AAX4IRC9_9PEZI|nr:hypothetical protein CDEST_10783 [Colletotrichum destructivum]